EADDLHGDVDVQRRLPGGEHRDDALEQLAVDVALADGDGAHALLGEGHGAVVGLALADAAHGGQAAVLPPCAASARARPTTAPWPSPRRACAPSPSASATSTASCSSASSRCSPPGSRRWTSTSPWRSSAS